MLQISERSEHERRPGERHTAGFVESGGERQIPRIESSAVIARPIEDVFAFTVNLEHEPIWISGAIRSEYTSTGPVGVGTTGPVGRSWLGPERQVHADHYALRARSARHMGNGRRGIPGSADVAVRTCARGHPRDEDCGSAVGA